MVVMPEGRCLWPFGRRCRHAIGAAGQRFGYVDG
jgi:hypothetical protein